jgi:hypothetical protein
VGGRRAERKGGRVQHTHVEPDCNKEGRKGRGLSQRWRWHRPQVGQTTTHGQACVRMRACVPEREARKTHWRRSSSTSVSGSEEKKYVKPLSAPSPPSCPSRVSVSVPVSEWCVIETLRGDEMRCTSTGAEAMMTDPMETSGTKTGTGEIHASPSLPVYLSHPPTYQQRCRDERAAGGPGRLDGGGRLALLRRRRLHGLRNVGNERHQQ